MVNLQKRKISTLYERDQYLNKSIDYIISSDIIEYDISSAGYSISRRYKLLDEKTLDMLGSLDKKSRQIRIGLLCRDNPKYNEALKSAFVNIRKEFFMANSITDDDILSIKKDAIFLLRHVNNVNFGDYVTFAEKNKYSSYFYINKTEFYVGSGTLDVKGISDDKLELHRDYMLDFLYNIFKMMEVTDFKYIIKELVAFTNHYKARNLDVGYYRELNSESSYRMIDDFCGHNIGIDYVDDVENVNISYNYMNYIRPLIAILL